MLKRCVTNDRLISLKYSSICLSMQEENILWPKEKTKWMMSGIHQASARAGLKINLILGHKDLVVESRGSQ